MGYTGKPSSTMTHGLETRGYPVAGTPRSEADAPSHAPVLEPRPGGPAERIAARMRSHHPATVFMVVALAGFAVLATAAIALGLLLMDVLLGVHGLGHDDNHVDVVLAHHRTGALNTASYVMSGIADVFAIPAVVALTVIAAAVKRHWRIAAFVLAAIIVEAATYRVTSMVIERHRPFVHRLDNLPVMQSYPSGHVAASVAVFVGVALIITSRYRSAAVRSVVWTVALLIPPLVALSRMYRGMHHPTDTLAGLLIGIGALLVALLAARTAGAVWERRSATR
jgi:membrane-associated phospholipid phosphatase